MTPERDLTATVSVTLTYHGVPCRDTTDAMRKVMQWLPLREISRAVDAMGGDDVRIDIGYVAVYEAEA